MYPYAILFGGSMAVYANGGSVIFIEGTDDLNTVKDIATFAATMGHDGDLGIQANGYVELVGSAEVEIGISSSDSEIDTDGITGDCTLMYDGLLNATNPVGVAGHI